jgi:hypothetical protein
VSSSVLFPELSKHGLKKSLLLYFDSFPLKAIMCDFHIWCQWLCDEYFLLTNGCMYNCSGNSVFYPVIPLSALTNIKVELISDTDNTKLRILQQKQKR